MQRIKVGWNRIKGALEVIALVGDLILLTILFTTDYIPSAIRAISGVYASFLSALVVGLALAGIALIPFLLGMRYMKRQTPIAIKNAKVEPTRNEQAERGFKFYHSRDKLPDLKKFLDSAKEEIILVGGTLEIMKHRADIFDAIMKKEEPRVKTKLFLMDEQSTHITELEKAIGQEGIASSIHATLQALCSIRRGLSDLQRERIEIRTYKMLPLCSMMIIDRKMIRVEAYIYGIRGAGERPSFEYPKSDFPDEFARYWKGYEHILENSVEYRC